MRLKYENSGYKYYLIKSTLLDHFHNIIIQLLSVIHNNKR